jgi:uncharacterized protein (TIGR02246 family)
MTTLTVCDERALRRLAERYAQAVDQNDGDSFAKLFTADGVLDSPTGRHVGHDSIRRIPGMVRSRYLKTFHAVLNQLPTLSGDDVTAETYCIARHLLADAEGTRCYEMTLRYQDVFVRADGEWRFASRRLVVDWTQTYPVQCAAHPASGPVQDAK